jgi:hypothetical protein
MVGRPPYIETYDASRSKGFTDIVRWRSLAAFKAGKKVTRHFRVGRLRLSAA